MKLHDLKPNRGATKSKQRVGRGNGSGRGTYCGRGGKGQTARTGGKVRIGFSGGQTTVMMRMPKLGGFKSPRKIEYAVVNVGTLAKHFKAGDTVDVNSLIEKHILRSSSCQKPIKILGTGDLDIALTIKVDKVSQSAVKKIEKASGKIETV